MSNAYRRPVERIAAPSASVLPPAPAQKSTIISPRLGATSEHSNWLPSSCTSTQPCWNASSLVSGGLPTTRTPNGANGVAPASMPAFDSAFSTSSRLALIGFARRSSGAG